MRNSSEPRISLTMKQKKVKAKNMVKKEKMIWMTLLFKTTMKKENKKKKVNKNCQKKRLNKKKKRRLKLKMRSQTSLMKIF